MYWKINLEELPSRGKLYNKEAQIKIRPVSVGDMKFLATITPENCTQIINELLENVLELKNISINDIYLCDRIYLCFWLRANSFINHNGYTFKIICEKCHKEHDHEITLNEFETRYLIDFPKPVTLPGSNEIVKLKIPTINDLKFSYPLDKDLEKIGRCLDGFTSLTEKKIFLQNLEALDYAYLISKVKFLDAGFEESFVFNCPSCGYINTFRVKINDDGLFGGINLYDILKKIVQITKYTTMQINDDIPWLEMELYTDIVNKMIEEENEANQKQMSLANSRMSSVNSQIHKPNISRPNISKPNIHR